MDNSLILLTCLILHCMVNAQTLTTAGHEHGRELNLLHSLQSDINNLKTEHASTLNQLSSTLLHLSSTLSQVAELQHDMRVIKEELRKEKESNRVFQREVMRLKNLTNDFDLEINRTRLPHSDLLSVKEALAFELDLGLKQQKDEIMNEISRIKTNFIRKTSATSTTISGIINAISDIHRKIYFTAGTIHDIDKHWAPKEIIIFPHVISNYGGGYDASTGVFTAPNSGVYIFMSFLASYTNAAEANIVLNGSLMVGIPAIAGVLNETHRYSAAGNSAVLQLAQGDRVWVEHTFGSVLFTRFYAPFPTFSGFRLG